MIIPRIEVALTTGLENEKVEEMMKEMERIGVCGPVGLVVNDGEVTVEKVKLMAKVLRKKDCRVGPVSAENVEMITEWLNNGALSVLVRGSIDAIAQVGAELPKDRIVASIDDLGDLSDEDIDILSQFVGSIVLTVSSLEDADAKAEEAHARLGSHFKRGFSFFVQECGAVGKEKVQVVGKLHHAFGSDHPIHIESSQVYVSGESSEANSETGIDLADALISCLRTDRPDGMFSCVVVDELGIALGLVYSNEISIRASINEMRGIYWSRSRNELWRKGDSSGAIQELVGIDFDCDADAVRFKVRQLGSPASFCHQGWRGCWGDDSGVPHLFRTLEARKADAPEGSYTKRLFDDRKLLRNKLLEEAQEVIEAVEENDPVHVAEEVADLTYFMLTACVSGNATLHDVYRVLDERSRKVKRRPGNAKEYRIQQAEAVLSEQQNKSNPN